MAAKTNRVSPYKRRKYDEAFSRLTNESRSTHVAARRLGSS
ncbi:hypothetical protein [Hymenobacter negativus]|nr:hypothetical protein [Hymenobacter negativus]